MEGVPAVSQEAPSQQGARRAVVTAAGRAEVKAALWSQTSLAAFPG